MNTLILKPHVSLALYWTSRMQKALQKRYGAVISGYTEETAQLHRDYMVWDQTREAAQTQIKLVFALTGSLPVVGDHLDVLGGKPQFIPEILRIKQRLFHTPFESETVHIIYFLESSRMKTLEYD